MQLKDNIETICIKNMDTSESLTVNRIEFRITDVKLEAIPTRGQFILDKIR